MLCNRSKKQEKLKGSCGLVVRAQAKVLISGSYLEGLLVVS